MTVAPAQATAKVMQERAGQQLSFVTSRRRRFGVMLRAAVPDPGLVHPVRVELSVLAARGPGEMGARTVGGHAVEPGRKTGLTTKTGEAAQGTQIGLLGHVKGVLLVAGEAVSEGVGAGPSHADKLFKGVTVTTSSRIDQCLQCCSRRRLAAAPPRTLGAKPADA